MTDISMTEQLEEARKKVAQGIQIGNLTILLTLKVLHQLRVLDTSGEGVEFKALVDELKPDDMSESLIDDILFNLSYEGLVYQPKPEYFKLMDEDILW